MTKSSVTLRQQVEQLRHRIATLEAEKMRIKSAWLARDVVATRASAAIDAASERFAARLNADLAAAARPYPAPFNFLGPSANASDVGDALCFLFGDTIRARIGELLESLPWRGDGQEEAARTARLNAVELDLLNAVCELDALRDELETIDAHH